MGVNKYRQDQELLEIRVIEWPEIINLSTNAEKAHGNMFDFCHEFHFISVKHNSVNRGAEL